MFRSIYDSKIPLESPLGITMTGGLVKAESFDIFKNQEVTSIQGI